MLLEHEARTRAPTGPRSFVFATRDGKPLGQRNLMRVLYVAQERARDADGRPTFPELFEHDVRGELVVDDGGNYVRRNIKRRELRLPTFHALRHGAAMDCDDAEEARDLLRHKLERHACDLPRALRRSPARAAAHSYGGAHGNAVGNICGGSA